MVTVSQTQEMTTSNVCKRHQSDVTERCLMACQSELERQFFIGFGGVCKSVFTNLKYFPSLSDNALSLFYAMRNNNREFVIVSPQFSFKRLICCDFMIMYNMRGRSGRIAIECDGDKYHWSTVDQVRRDIARDNLIASKNVPLFKIQFKTLQETPEQVYSPIMALIDKTQQLSEWKTCLTLQNPLF